MLASLGVIDLWTYVLGTVLVILLPGPNSLFVLASAARRGVAAGYSAAAAVFIGDSLLMLAAALGVVSLLKAEPLLFVALKYLGAAYLFYIGFNMLRGAWRQWHQPQQKAAGTSAHELAEPFRRALLLSLSNPKAILFFVSFFIQFVDPAYANPGLSFLVLGTILQVISLTYLSVLIFTGARLAQWFRQRQRLVAGASSGIGALFVGFGVKLATATLS
ncbi:MULTISPECIES: leucine efflux protein LeuE [Pseudomonas]|jgi:leucine efflux protein|uniref:Leucine efflux protein LeuE n=1 Tax=Serpens gallinarum TaxID=2763075 RepID=A0ABR8TKD0_9PSED|nr:leucine efflux protein LeuE [Serpens gallinarum]MBF0675622.1 leucine efflux protein LeuE [Pseudomonas sp.]